jgi:hypothetical protein
MPSSIVTGSRVTMIQTKWIFWENVKSTRNNTLRLEHVETNCRSKRMLIVEIKRERGK